MIRTHNLTVIILLLFTITGCNLTRGPVRIGIKSFDEQRTLSSMISILTEQEGIRSTIIQCGDTYECQKAMQQGDIDVMIDYTGTVLNLGGISDPSGVSPEKRVKDFYRSIGLRWLVDIGFDNDYVAVVSAVRSALQDIKSIPDLAKKEGDIKLAVHPAYVRRPGDGLYPLARRYGLNLDDNPLLIADPNKRYRAVLEGRADAAIGFNTDGFLADDQLRILEDPQQFFRAYSAGIIVSEDALSNYQNLEETLLQLNNRIGTHTMRLLNSRVQLKGRSPERVAMEFLRQKGLLEETFERRFGQPELNLVSEFNNQLDVYLPEALDIINRAFPDLEVRHENVYDPVESLVDGHARLALVGAEDFFTSMSGITIKRETRVEAISVVGIRYIQIIQNKRTQSPEPFEGRFGIVSDNRRSSAIRRDILEIAGVKPSVYDNARELLDAVISGEVDKALIVSTVPDPLIAQVLMQNGELELMPLPENWISSTRLFIAPYLRNSRIPENSYPGQDKSISTLSAQVVLAGPSLTDSERTHVGGLVSAVKAGGIPFTMDEAGKLLTAGIKTEMPDPVLPSPWTLRFDAQEVSSKRIEDKTEVILNILAIAYIVGLIYLLNQQLGVRNNDPD